MENENVDDEEIYTREDIKYAEIEMLCVVSLDKEKYILKMQKRKQQQQQAHAKKTSKK